MPSWAEDILFWVTLSGGLVGLAGGIAGFIGRKRASQLKTAYQDAMENLQRRLVEAVERLADARTETTTTTTAPPKDSMLSVSVIKTGRHSYKLVITNRGPGSARVLDVQSLNDPNLLVGDLGLDDLVLLAGEHHEILAAPTFATPPHPKILATWLDESGTIRHREQTISI